MKNFTWTLMLLLLTGACPLAAELGLPAGAPMPDFELPDQNGTVRTLKTLLGPKGTIILVFRSADWCPYCKSQLVELDRSRERFAGFGVAVAAISYDSVAILRAFADRRQIHIPLLSDSDSRVIRALRVLNQSVPRDDPTYGVPYPCSFIIDANGIVLARYFEDNHLKTYKFGDILTRNLGIPGDVPTSQDSQDEHVKIIAKAGNRAVSAGKRVPITVDVDVAPGMHVYAEGSEDFKPLKLEIGSSKAVSASRFLYPASQSLTLDVANGSAPVYQGHIQIKGDITIADDEKLREAVDRFGYFQIGAVLRYQACKDRICYPPARLPIRWEFQYSAFDQERVPPALRRKAAQQ